MVFAQLISGIDRGSRVAGVGQMGMGSCTLAPLSSLYHSVRLFRFLADDGEIFPPSAQSTQAVNQADQAAALCSPFDKPVLSAVEACPERSRRGLRANGQILDLLKILRSC
jgi:hypothetical protein